MATRPAAEVEAVAFIFFQGRGIEYANNVLIELDCLHALSLPGCMPVQRIHILQNGEDAFTREHLTQRMRQMSGRQMRFAK